MRMLCRVTGFKVARGQNLFLITLPPPTLCQPDCIPENTRRHKREHGGDNMINCFLSKPNQTKAPRQKPSFWSPSSHTKPDQACIPENSGENRRKHRKTSQSKLNQSLGVQNSKREKAKTFWIKAINNNFDSLFSYTWVFRLNHFWTFFISGRDFALKWISKAWGVKRRVVERGGVNTPGVKWGAGASIYWALYITTSTEDDCRSMGGRSVQYCTSTNINSTGPAQHLHNQQLGHKES